jgi:hypothetical protein
LVWSSTVVTTPRRPYLRPAEWSASPPFRRHLSNGFCERSDDSIRSLYVARTNGAADFAFEGVEDVGDVLRDRLA